MTTHHYTWIGIDDPSRSDAAQAEFTHSGMRAAGSSITNSYATSWTLDVDDHWRTRHINVVATGETWSRYLDLSRSPAGDWTSETTVRGDTGLPSPGFVDGTDLTEAIDCDLGMCPLTNVMPIRRLGLLRGGVPETPLVMAWIDVPSLRVTRSDQIYGSGPGDGLVRYTSYSRDFSAELTVDPQGVVIEYPHLARRQTVSG